MNIEKAKRVVLEKVCNPDARVITCAILEALAEENQLQPLAGELPPLTERRLTKDDVEVKFEDHGGGFHVHLSRKNAGEIGTFTAKGFFKASQAARYSISEERGGPCSGGRIFPPDDGGYGVVIREKA